MKYLYAFVFWGMLAAVNPAAAYTPVFPDPVVPEATLPFLQYDGGTTYFGDLVGYPHAYEFTVTETTLLTLTIKLPAIAGILESQYKPSVILVRRDVRGVEDVTRLSSKDADWQSQYNPYTGDTYLVGPSTSVELDPGAYMLEVSTADNLGKYVLVEGGGSSFSSYNPTVVLSWTHQIKTFFGKGSFAMVESPFIYGPLGLVLFVIVYVYLRRKKHA